MNSEDLAQERTKKEAFIVARTTDGFRVASLVAPGTQFLVTGLPDEPKCTCPDFTPHPRAPYWHCKHVRAVHDYFSGQNGQTNNGSSEENGDGVSQSEPQKRDSNTSAAQMLLKRSVSPDGRIDSLSVEFTCPVGKTSSEEIKQRADKALKLQSEIIHGFLAEEGKGKAAQPNREPRKENKDSNAVNAMLLTIGSMETRRGRSLFVNVFVNGEVAKLFGNEDALKKALVDAGISEHFANIVDGAELNHPCRAITYKRGKYLNIERLLPALKKESVKP